MIIVVKLATIGENSRVADSETIATTKRTIEAWTRGDEDSIRAAFTADMVFEPTGAIPGYQEPVEGIERYVEFFRDWTSSWDSYDIELTRIVDLGDGLVLLDTTQRGINTASVAVERRVVMHARMRDRRCASYAAFETEADALAHAGLESWPESPN
jgi:ketosteroid isomerase-like protein